MNQDLIQGFIDEMAQEEGSHGFADRSSSRVFRIGRLGGRQSLDPQATPREELALLPSDEECLSREMDQEVYEDEVEDPIGEAGFTGSYSSRLFGASPSYFAEKILRRK